jgi:hypothetical protein
MEHLYRGYVNLFSSVQTPFILSKNPSRKLRTRGETDMMSGMQETAWMAKQALARLARVRALFLIQ